MKTMKAKYPQPGKRCVVKIHFITIFGEQMHGQSYPVHLETSRHVELLVPATGECVLLSKNEVH